MDNDEWEGQIYSFDERRNIIIPGNKEETIKFCTQHFIQIAQQSIQERDRFVVALSGGSTPHAIFKTLSEPSYRNQLDWNKIICFWSDERNVPPNHPENNYHTAMEAGLGTFPIPKDHLIRMEAEDDIEEGAQRYEKIFSNLVPSQRFDLMMLGMGEDGHTASLFPLTHGLHTKDKLFIANYVPQKQTWRMSATYACIHQSYHICLYVLGKSKADMVLKALTGPYDPDHLPVQRIGTPTHKALWILDEDAASKLIETLKA